MFNLNEQLTAWRQSFQGSEGLRTADLDELEQHVRDSVEALTSKGLAPEEAFAIALCRVGDSRRLTSEFSKINGSHIWAQRAFWMIVGFLALQCAGIAVRAIAGAGQLVAAFAGAGTSTLNATSVAVTIACWLGIAVGLVQSTRDAQGGPLARLCRMRRRQLIGLAAIVPVVTIIGNEASYLYLSTFMTREEFQPVGNFRHNWADYFSVALFVLLVVTADRLRRTGSEVTA
jgi:hypothetical protein